MIRAFENGDIVTSGQTFKTGKAATAQAIQQRLRMFRGEFFLDATDGTGWFQEILGKSPDGVAEASLKQRIISAQGVVNITQFSFKRDGDARSIQVESTVIDENNEVVKALLQEDIFNG